MMPRRKFPTLKLGLGCFALCTLSLHVHAISLLDNSSVWTYLHPGDGTDPGDTVTDFQSTWFTTGFDDSVASGWQSGSGSFGYATINFFGGSPDNDFGQPAEGDRFTAYFRADFTTTEAVDNLSLSLLADDGAFIYLDGVRVSQLNFLPSDEDTYFNVNTLQETGEPDNQGNENSLTVIDLSSLGVLAAGSHTIAISVHQNSSSSSDLGFQADLDATAVPELRHYGVFAGLAVLGFAAFRRRRQ